MIQLSYLLPLPIKEHFNGQSQIWHSNVTFEIGKKYLVAAPSGRGKSTLLSIIYGLRFDYEGIARWKDVDIRTFSANKWAELRAKHLSYAFQGMHLFANLTVWENLKIKSMLTHHQDSKRMAEMAGILGISHLLKKKVKYLSFGERQRISLIRCLIQPFDFLMLDEPFANLDPYNAQLAAALIDEEVEKRNAGLVVADIDHSHQFKYDTVFDL